MKKIIYNLNLSLIYFLFITLLNADFLYAYPEFIGHGYATCMTCHYNGGGNGPLNDYGRSLFAAEIAAKPFWNTKLDDETLSEYSGLFGSVQLPYWLRFNIKYRGLSAIQSPLRTGQVKKFYGMQKDLDTVISFDEDQKYIFAFNLGLVEKPIFASPNKTFNETEILTREHYFRNQFSDSLWMYLGFMDKAYGIRHPDHTAFNRGALNAGQNDQTHGLTLQYAIEKHEFFFNPYIGNLFLKRAEQFSGLSMLYLFEPSEKRRVGITSMAEETEILKRLRGALIFEAGMGEGNSVLMEGGLFENTTFGQKPIRGAYAWTQATMKLKRGIYFQSIGQYSKQNIQSIYPENFRWGLGFKYFPMQRIEILVQAIQGRIIPLDDVKADSWTFQSQLHLSL